ncbi:hypothetical protein [Taibaiella soli]|uniref:Uncharacterized protein n=1 Tax=Taibaiella soli TaxID=1649169 RepID=A0A2W2BDX0_9BACT|nr:hypothetical protein [Taibaiella soli]PZF74459.1 hypothetical protein DN068_02440 [Taibaiella soli]
MDKYQTGNGTQQVKLAVDITTTGMAATRAFTLTDTTTTSVAASSDATGDIRQTTIGTAASIQGSTLSITTKIHITGKDINARQAEFNGLKALYVLDNGQQGHAEYSFDFKNDIYGDYTDVELYKNISLY